MVLYTLVNQQKYRKKKMIRFWVKKAEETQKSATMILSVEGKETVFPVKLKSRGLNKDIKKESFKKDSMNLKVDSRVGWPNNF